MLFEVCVKFSFVVISTFKDIPSEFFIMFSLSDQQHIASSRISCVEDTFSSINITRQTRSNDEMYLASNSPTIHQLNLSFDRHEENVDNLMPGQAEYI